MHIKREEKEYRYKMVQISKGAFKLKFLDTHMEIVAIVLSDNFVENI